MDPGARSQIPKVAWGLAALALVVRIGWLGLKGFQRSPDSAYYLRAADSVLAIGFFDTMIEMHGAWKYSSSIAIVSLLRAVFGEHVQEAWVLLGIVTSSLVVIPLFLLARDLYDARVATLACLLYIGSFDILQWTSFALTDTLFLSASVTFVWMAARAWRTRARGDAGWAFGLGAIVATMRIVGVVYAAVVLIWLVSSAVDVRWRTWTPSRRRAAGWAIVAIAVAGVVGSLVGIGTINPAIAEYFAEGNVVDDDSTTNVDVEVKPYPTNDLLGFAIANPVAFAKIFFVKLGSFWIVFNGRYSLAHNVLNAVSLVPIVVIGLPMLGRSLFDDPVRAQRRLLFLLVVALTFFHALTVIDYDFRYRSPVLPLLAVFAAVPLAALWSRSAWQWKTRD